MRDPAAVFVRRDELTPARVPWDTDSQVVHARLERDTRDRRQAAGFHPGSVAARSRGRARPGNRPMAAARSSRRSIAGLSGSFLSLLVLVFVACSGQAPTAAGGGGAPADTAGLDLAARTSAVIGRWGGWLATRGRDGTRYTLSVPVGAVHGSTEFVLTPYRRHPAADSLGMLDVGVKLEPAGARFDPPVVITVQPDPATAASPPYGLLRIDEDGHVALVGRLLPNLNNPLAASLDHFSSVAATAVTDTLLVMLWHNTELEIATFGVQVEYVQNLVDLYQAANSYFYGSPIIDLQAWADAIHTYNRDLLAKGAVLCSNGQCFEGRRVLDHVVAIADMMFDSVLSAEADSARSACRDLSVDVQVTFSGTCGIPANGATGTVTVTVQRGNGTPADGVTVDLWLEGAGTLESTGGITDTSGVWTTRYTAPDQPPSDVPKIHASVPGACDPTVETVVPVTSVNPGAPGTLTFTLLEAGVAVYVCCDDQDNEFYSVNIVVNDTTAANPCVPDIGDGGRFDLSAGVRSPYGMGAGQSHAGIEGGTFFASGPGFQSNSLSIDSSISGVLRYRRSDGSAFPPGTVLEVQYFHGYGGGISLKSWAVVDSSWSDPTVNPPLWYYRLVPWTGEVKFLVGAQSVDYGYSVGVEVSEWTGR